MRIIAGRFKGRRLAPIRGKVRPTSDRLREAFFNVIADSVRGSFWLDLFAGSGAIGLEALSRGASFVHFNDSSETALKTVHRNLEICQVDSGFAVSNLDAETLLREEGVPSFTHLFMDPPYAFPKRKGLLKAVLRSPKLVEDVQIFLEVFKKTNPVSLPEGLDLIRTLKAGDSHIWFLKR